VMLLQEILRETKVRKQQEWCWKLTVRKHMTKWIEILFFDCCRQQGSVVSLLIGSSNHLLGGLWV
jgi:hypothetical protein